MNRTSFAIQDWCATLAQKFVMGDSMAIRIPLAALCLGVIAATPAIGYDMKADFAVCMQGKGTKQQIVQACTNLIDNAAKENEMVGYFYALRASHNGNRKLNCGDGRKVMQLVKDPKVVDAAKTIIKNNC